MFAGFPAFIFVHLYLATQACLSFIFAGLACMMPGVASSLGKRFGTVLISSLCSAIVIFMGVIAIRQPIKGLMYDWEPGPARTMAHFAMTTTWLVLVAGCRIAHYRILNKALPLIKENTKSFEGIQKLWFASFFALMLCADTLQCVLWLEDGW
jgi:uncharacterized membrane protein